MLRFLFLFCRFCLAKSWRSLLPAIYTLTFRKITLAFAGEVDYLFAISFIFVLLLLLEACKIGYTGVLLSLYLNHPIDQYLSLTMLHGSEYFTCSVQTISITIFLAFYSIKISVCHSIDTHYSTHTDSCHFDRVWLLQKDVQIFFFFIKNFKKDGFHDLSLWRSQKVTDSRMNKQADHGHETRPAYTVWHVVYFIWMMVNMI